MISSSNEPRQRRAGQLAPGGQQLLGDERQPARAFRDEEQQAGRRPFALDALDQRRQLVPIERRDQQPLRRPRAGDDRGEVARPRVVEGHHVRLMRADDDQPLLARDPRQERDQRAAGGIGEVEVLDHEDHRVPLPEPAEEAEDALERPCLAPLRGGRPRVSAGIAERRQDAARDRAAGGRPRTLPARATRPAHRRAGRAGRGRSPGRSARRARRRGPARPRHGARSAARARAPIRSIASSRKRVTPTPAVPSRRTVRRSPMRRVVERGGKAGEGLVAPHELRARVRGRHDGIIRAASARLDRHDRHPEPAASRQHAQRAARRGMAVLHQVAHDHGLPIRAGPRRPEGAWREQAAAADGPPDRVLQPDRRARARSVRRGRGHAPRGGRRARPAPGARDRARAALGDRVRVGRPRPRAPNGTGWAPTLADLGPADPGGPRRLRSSRAGAARGRRAGDPAHAR